MPTVLQVGPYRFFFFSKENQEPPHIHVAANGKEAKLWLAGLGLASSYGFRPKELSEIRRIAEQNQQLLLEAWNEHFSR